jgi:predicted Ser/Thr protein kinase
VTTPTKIGRYEIIERVGRGGMGAVYRGKDTILDREVAVKVMSSDFAADESSRPRFYREARAAAKLQHRNIVTIFEFGEEDETPFIVMEFLRGQDLSKRMRSEPPLLLEEKLDIIAELCTGLHFAHEQGVIHRDVKPANIWLVPDGSVKLLDFGIAKFSSSTMTRQGSVFGSISYMSPEQVNGAEIDGRADIFSAGVVLYELLCGKKPFVGDSPTAVLARIMDDEPAPASNLPGDLPRPLVTAVLRALEKDRDKRYRHAADFGADLRLVRSALATGTSHALASTDFAETTFTDSGSAVVTDSGRQPAGAFTVSRALDPAMPAGTAPLQPATAPLPADVRKVGWLVPFVAVIALGLAVGGWFMVRGRGDGVPPGAASQPGPASAKSLIKVESQPPGARISVNDVETGRVTPADVEVDASQLPRVTLKLGARPPVTAQLTSEDVKNGGVLLHLDRAAPEKPAVAPVAAASPAAAVPEAKTKVVMSGDYPFEIVQNGRVISPAADSHEVVVTGRPRLYIRNADYFLNQPVQVDGTDPFEWRAPSLGKLELRARETCTVTIADRNLGEPPIIVTMAAGTYTAVVQCDGQIKRETFSIAAGTANRVAVK